MAVSIDWATKVILIPQADLDALGGAVYGLDIEWLRNELKNIEDSEAGMPHPATHQRNAPYTVSGVTYAQSFEVINGYTITFEETGPHYTVICSGANHNIADVLNFNNVNLIIGNSAGLIVKTVGSGLSVDEQARLTRIEKILRNKTITNPDTGTMTVYDDDGSTVLLQGDLFEDAAGSQSYRGKGAERRERLA